MTALRTPEAVRLIAAEFADHWFSGCVRSGVHPHRSRCSRRRIRQLDARRYAVAFSRREQREFGLKPLIVEIVDEDDPQYRLDFIQRALHAAELDGDARACARLRKELRALQNAEAARLAAEFQRRMPKLDNGPARAARELLRRHAEDPA